MRVAPPIVLGPEERATLHRWARGVPGRDRRALRARIVLAAADGLQDLEIGRTLGVSRLTAARWRHRFLEARLRGIERVAARTPGEGRIPAGRVQGIVRATAQGSSTGPRRVSTRRLARQFGVSHSTVQRVWATFGVRPSPVEAVPRRPDPVRPWEIRDVVGLYLRPPDHVIALSLGPRSDRAGPLTVLPEPSPAPPLPTPGIVPWGGDAGRPGTTGRASTRQRLRELLRFLGEVERGIGRRVPARIVARLPSLEGEPSLRSWQARRPHVHLETTGSVEAWRTRALQALDLGGRVPSRRSSYHGRSEVTRSIGLFLSSYRESRGPFVWVARPTEVAADAAGARLRYDLSVTGPPGLKNAPGVAPAMRRSSPPDAAARAMARVILRKCLKVRPGEHVTIESWSETLEAANALVLEALRAGARPLLLYQDEPTYWAAVSESRPSQLGRVGAHLRAAIASSDVLVTFFGPSDRERFHALPTGTMFRLSAYRDSLYAAAAKAGIRAVEVALGRASPASARMYGVDLDAWKAELVAGTTVDPAWLHRRARRVARLFQTGREIEITHPNGTHLQLRLRHRRPQVSDGLVPRARPRGDWNLVQLPAGVVSVALDERSAEGSFRSNVRNSVGVFDTVGEVEGGRWTFSAGRLVRYSYDRGQELFSESYARGGAGRDRVGVLSVGLNPAIVSAPLLLDQGAGTLTLQIGRNDTAGGTNRVHWWAWLILRGADLTVDKVPVLRAGALVD